MSEQEPLDRFFEQVKPRIPDDAADRVLRALELERAARRALRWSALLALLGAGALAFSLAHDKGVRFHWSLHHAIGHGHSAKDGGTFAFVSPDERRLADPFPAKRN